MGFVFVIYVGIAFVALYTFGSKIESDILKNLEQYSDAYAIIL